MRKRTTITVVVLAIVAILIWINYTKIELYFIARDRKPQQMPPAIVQAVQAKTEEWQDQVQATGTITAFKGITLKAQVEGQVTAIYFDSGKTVQAGDKLIQIYPDVIVAELQQAQADLTLAQVDYKRYADLLKKNVTSQSDVDKKFADMKKDQAIVNQYEATLTLYNITAPFTGEAGLQQVSIGQFLTKGDPIVNLQQLDPIRVDFSIPDKYSDDVQVGQKVIVAPSSQPDKPYIGQVVAFDSAVDVDTRSIGVWASIPNPDKKLIPGTYGLVTLFIGQKRTVVVVPQTAVVYGENGNSVYEVVDNTAKKVDVTIGNRRGDEIEVTSGLKAGTLVISDGQVKLADGSPIALAGDIPTDPQAQEAMFKGIEQQQQEQRQEKIQQMLDGNKKAKDKTSK